MKEGAFWSYRFLIIGIPQFTVMLYHGTIFASRWFIRELFYSLRLFWYTSKRFLRVESYLALIGAFIFFGYLLTEGQIQTNQELLQQCYIYFTVVMILLAMNLLPRERDEETLEILWSQPMSRNWLIVVQMLTLTVWGFVLCMLVVGVFSYFTAYEESPWLLVLFVITTSFAVGVITVLISTFCRHAIATGLVALLIFGIHYFWLSELGPIQLYMNPVLAPGADEPRDYRFEVVFNRVILCFLVGFILDYLFRRLRRTAEWFT